MENEAEKKKQKERVKQHETALWEALNLPYKGDYKNEYQQENDMKKRIRNIFEDIAEALKYASISSLPSQLLTQGYQHILDAYIPKNKQQELLYILDKQNKFAYSTGYFRRTVRSSEYWQMHSYSLERIFDSYYNLSFYAESMADYYKNTEERRELENLLGRYDCPALHKADDIIASELDAGTTDLAQVLEDILMSENNTNIVSTDIIRGIVKSGNKHLHKILGDFLLAARLQEGVRQAVCENMDCGTTEAFLTLFKVITENDLIRFSAVKRAVSTWTGICDESNLERISNKQTDLMEKALWDREYCYTLTQSNDSIELYIGLWALGFFEVNDAIARCKELITDGTKNQKLVVSYYNRSLQYRSFTMQTASLMLETHPQDMELCAAFLPTYMPDSENAVQTALFGKPQNGCYGRQTYVYEKISCETFFADEAQARRHFALLKQLYEILPKKGRTYSPCIFPWYSVSISPAHIANKMAVIAYMLQDNEMIDLVCPLLSEIDSYSRGRYLSLLLHSPKTALQKQTLLQALGDKSSYARTNAFRLVSDLTLDEKDYEQIGTLLKYKAADTRKYVLDLLENQPDDRLSGTIAVLLADKKEEVRLGGLDLMVRLKKNEKRQKLYHTCCSLLTDMEHATEKESIIIAELTGSSQADSVRKEKGYGLYNPDAALTLPEIKDDTSMISSLFHMTKKEMYQLLDKLEELYTANQNLEYKNYMGEERLLGDGFFPVTYRSGIEVLERYPFPELWKGFYKEHIKDFSTLLNLYIFIIASEANHYDRMKMNYFLPLAEKVYGKDYLDTDLTRYKRRGSLVQIIKNLFFFYSDKEENKKLLSQAAHSLFALFLSLPKEESIYRSESDSAKNKVTHYAFDVFWFSFFASNARNWKTEEEFDDMFLRCQTVNRYYESNVMKLSFLDYVKAYERKLISMDNVYQAAFDARHHVGLLNTFSQIRQIVCYPEAHLTLEQKNYLKDGEEFEENKVYQTALDIYWKIVEMILKVELKRSELETEFSYVVSKIWRVRGAAYLVDILTALGKDTLERSVYYSYYRNGNDKKTCLSQLLYASEPLPEENGKTLKKLLKGRKISDKRLVEVAMYNPKWIDCIEEYLGWSGLKSGIYYFMAHMNERFSDRTAAIIAKYTPLSAEELNNGAFDLNWFLECSRMLGEERFKILYDSAKYISDSNKHTRARKYADAAQGRVTAEELEAAIQDKRNKDLLMSYALIPVKEEKDVLHRYQFLQKFLKESKQFGAQRRASESTAVSMGLQNLAANTGYSDVTRLTLNMETKLVENMTPYFNWQTAADVQLKIQVGEDGKPAVVCEKNGKSLKSIPAKLKKDELVIEIKDVCRQLKDQYTRTKAMLEQFMEDGVEFTASEMANLQKNPVIRPLLKDLVYLCGEQTGFLQGMILTDYTGKEQKLTPKKKLRIAHPFDLWSLHIWQEYQKLLFERKVKQPFKQVFRELYVKTEEELDRTNSLRYAGNQIQPQKTVACLKGRRWIADYEDGLQKVYYKENIVARIYALADWFSPSDLEAPTLEWVEFSDRKTFERIPIKDVPDRIFSEVMRDVDLAVSVAHAGGVDPETSHSTMEMRKAIIEFNLPLFGLTNVSFTGNHAVIEGTRGTYTIHLGSGVIFKRGGAQIAVLPVHSQHRGKLFLPFIDEDPKTAEIMSKVVLFAEDGKIKDPYILNQL